MPTFLIPLLTLFAKPLGTLLNTALMTASASFVTWSMNHGLDQGTAATVAAGLVGGVSALAQWAASTQGVNIAVINNDTSNGARVVDSDKAKAAGIPKLDPTAPKV